MCTREPWFCLRSEMHANSITIQHWSVLRCISKVVFFAHGETCSGREHRPCIPGRRRLSCVDIIHRDARTLALNELQNADCLVVFLVLSYPAGPSKSNNRHNWSILAQVVDTTFDLFAELAVSDDQLDFATVYASGKLGEQTHLCRSSRFLRQLLGWLCHQSPIAYNMPSVTNSL